MRQQNGIIASKGSVVLSVSPFHLIRLDAYQHEDAILWETLSSRLPKFSWTPLLSSTINRFNNSSVTASIRRIQQQLFSSSSMASPWCKYVTLSAMHLIVSNSSISTTWQHDNMDDKPKRQQGTSEAPIHENEPKVGDDAWNEADQEAILQAWTMLHQMDGDINVNWESWCRLVTFLDQNLFLLIQPHPMIQYSQLLSTLTPTEYETSVRMLRSMLLKTKIPNDRNWPHLLKVQKTILDEWEDQPIVIAMLLEQIPPWIFDQSRQDSDTRIAATMFAVAMYPSNGLPSLSSSSSSVRWTRSWCLPTAAWELQEREHLNQQPRVSLIAMFDLVDDDDDAEEEEGVVVIVTPFPGASPPSNCHCYRCRNEKDPTVFRQLTLFQRKRLADSCMQQPGRIRDAQRLYRDILDDPSITKSSRTMQDVYHAMGASYLQEGHFLKAQRYWNDCVKEHPTLMSHTGIALQIEKQRAYGYLKDSSTDEESTSPFSTPQTTRVPDYQVLIPSLCFVAPQLVDGPTCRQVIDWANGTASSSWTSQRHYAVPTTDVAVHTVPPLLRWFVSWMKDTVQPLLSHQFGSSSHHRYYCHDAFCVKYEPHAPNSHLPIHCDESTHSIVLSLNDGFEGGGTYFVDHDLIVTASMGSMVSFRGDDLRHGGNMVTKGVRYILAVFLYLDHDSSKEVDTKKRALPHLLHEEVATKRHFSFGFDFS